MVFEVASRVTVKSWRISPCSHSDTEACASASARNTAPLVNESTCVGNTAATEDWQTAAHSCTSAVKFLVVSVAMGLTSLRGYSGPLRPGGGGGDGGDHVAD